MANSWIMALKHWNSMKGGKYVVPKKGSKEYTEVKAVQNSMINGKGLKQLGTGHSKKKNVKMSKKKRGRPKKQSGRGNDDEWVDTNVDIIGELEEAGVPVPTELSLVNTVYDTFGPKAPQVNKKTGAVRPAPGLFDFLNFEF
jgi:hypothetical protein